MAMLNQFFDRLRPRRSVLQRTRRREEFPEIAFYVEWLPATSQRKVLDAEGKEHTLDDTVLESNYKLASGGTAKKLIAKHWAKEEAKKGTPYVAPKPEPEPKPEKKAKAEPAPAKKATKKAVKKPAAKKATKKVAKKPAAKKATKKAGKKK